MRSNDPASTMGHEPPFAFTIGNSVNWVECFFVNCTLTKTLQCANVVGVIEKADESEVECIDPGSWQHDGDVVGRLCELHDEGFKFAQPAQVRTSCEVVLS